MRKVAWSGRRVNEGDRPVKHQKGQSGFFQNKHLPFIMFALFSCRKNLAPSQVPEVPCKVLKCLSLLHLFNSLIFLKVPLNISIFKKASSAFVILPNLHPPKPPNPLLCVTHLSELHYIWFPGFYIFLFSITYQNLLSANHVPGTD